METTKAQKIDSVKQLMELIKKMDEENLNKLLQQAQRLSDPSLDKDQYTGPTSLLGQALASFSQRREGKGIATLATKEGQDRFQEKLEPIRKFKLAHGDTAYRLKLLRSEIEEMKTPELKNLLDVVHSPKGNIEHEKGRIAAKRSLDVQLSNRLSSLLKRLDQASLDVQTIDTYRSLLFKDDAKRADLTQQLAADTQAAMDEAKELILNEEQENLVINMRLRVTNLINNLRALFHSNTQTHDTQHQPQPAA